MRFSLADLFWTVGLLAMAAAGAAVWVRGWLGPLPDAETVPEWCRLLMLLMVQQTPLSLCIGLAAPFRRKKLGAWIGWAIMTLLTIAMLIPPSIH